FGVRSTAIAARIATLVGGHTVGCQPSQRHPPPHPAEAFLDVRFANHGFPPWSWRRGDAGKPMIPSSAIHMHTRSAAKHLHPRPLVGQSSGCREAASSKAQSRTLTTPPT